MCLVFHIVKQQDESVFESNEFDQPVQARLHEEIKNIMLKHFAQQKAQNKKHKNTILQSGESICIFKIILIIIIVLIHKNSIN